MGQRRKAELKVLATRFVLMLGMVSLFADLTYEGSRSIIGPYLGLFGLGGTAISIITGAGELLGYGLRPFSGRLADTTKRFWAITIFGYIVQMVAVPLLAFSGNWLVAAWLVIQERMGKALRNPPRDVMLSHAAKEIGYGWAFGVHEVLDQAGALIGPVVIALVLASNGVSIGEYRTAFLYLAIPAIITLTLLTFTWRTYPHPEDLETGSSYDQRKGLSLVFWVYLAGVVLAGAGIGGFPLIAYHLQSSNIVPAELVPIFYALAMGASGIGSLVFGRLFDKVGMTILIPLTVISALALPLVWLGNFTLSLAGIALWGIGMGVQESLIPAAVATMVPLGQRTTAYGIFTAAYGISLFLGSAIIGILYSISIILLVIYSSIAELASIPIIFWVSRRKPKDKQ